MTEPIAIRRVTSLDPTAIAQLAGVLIDCVSGGASVGFMNPLSRATAETFWTGVASGVSDGSRILFVSEDTLGICGTVQLILASYENQPHRADLAKMLVHRRARSRGVGTALMRAAEAHAQSIGRNVLVLDTATGSDAERLYQQLGWTCAGVVPDYALWPDGGLTPTSFYYRRLG
jgi:GNAT superfamily N-acetyltransferase